MGYQVQTKQIGGSHCTTVLPTGNDSGQTVPKSANS